MDDGRAHPTGLPRTRRRRLPRRHDRPVRTTGIPASVFTLHRTVESLWRAGGVRPPFCASSRTRGLRPPLASIRGSHMLLWLLRIAYIAILIGTAIFSVSLFVEAKDWTSMVLAPLGILAIGGIVLLTDVREKQKQITTISAIYFGLL